MKMKRRATRVLAQVAAVGLAVAALNLASRSESLASEQPANATLAYSCPFPSGAQKITVRIAATFPGSGTAGVPIQPADVTITPILPRPALADLTKLDAASVTASVRLSTTVAQAGASADVAWSGLETSSTRIPGSGDLPLPASGEVPSATVKATGVAAFIAGPLTLVLGPHKANGDATDPDAVPLDCALEAGQSAVLATVPVTGPTRAATPPGTRAGTAAPDARRPAATDPCIISIDRTPVPGEAFLAGFSNVQKLNGASLLGRENGQTTGHTDLELGFRVAINVCSTDFSTDIFSRGMLDDNGKAQLPPAKATFLTFGFVPTTATLELTEPPGTDLEIDSHSFTPDNGNTFAEVTTIKSQLSIRIHDVLVNGVPLDVGPHCESATPMAVTLTGKSPEYTVNTGGPLTGTSTIPPFSGCGVGEDLDPIFTASISGPGNFMKLVQGMPCTRPPGQPPINCDPIERPEPQT